MSPNTATAERKAPADIGRADLEVYLGAVLACEVELLAVKPLVATLASEDPKGFGYGVPLEIQCVAGGQLRSFVIARTRPEHGFGHDYSADRAWQALWSHDAFNAFPRHVRSLDVGFTRRCGQFVSAADAVEFFQLVEKATGTLYWLDLERLLAAPLGDLDVPRVETLARFLADVHRTKRDEPTLYHRRIRELVGHGECLMGILDSYPHPYALLPKDVCEEIEQSAVQWRWRLRERVERLSQVHSDFHPWNLLFREGTDFSVLDRSRGEWGEPADDVAALAVNYLFYGLRKQAASGARDPEPFRYLFSTFVETYLRESGDRGVLEALPPFLAFRALVIAHPRWYQTLAVETRRALIRFARRMMQATALTPADISELFASRA